MSKNNTIATLVDAQKYSQRIIFVGNFGFLVFGSAGYNLGICDRVFWNWHNWYIKSEYSKRIGKYNK